MKRICKGFPVSLAQIQKFGSNAEFFPAYILNIKGLFALSLLSLPLWLELWKRKFSLPDLVGILTHHDPSAHLQFTHSACILSCHYFINITETQ